MNNNNLEKVFDVDVEVLPPEPPKIPPVPALPKPKQSVKDIKNEELEKFLIDDLKVSREDLDTIIDLGKDALSQVLTIASEGQHPRFFEAAAMLIKSINEANRERMELYLKISQIRKNQADVGDNKSGNVNIEKGVFIGTTQQLLEMLNGAKKELKHEPIDS